MKKALLVIDVQNEYFTGKLPVTHPAGSLENICKAMDAASTNGVPVVLVQHTVTAPDRPVFQKGSQGGLGSGLEMLVFEEKSDFSRPDSTD